MWKKIIGIFVCMLFIVSSIVPSSVALDNITINDNNIGTTDTITLYPTDDAYIHQGYTNNNYGSSLTLYVCNMFGNDYWEHDALIKFDISSLPHTATILSASLNLYYCGYVDNNPTGRPITCHRITNDWDEMTVTWNTRPSYSSITSSANVPSSWGWMSWDVKNDISDFVSGSVINYGWQLMDETYWGWFNIPQTAYKSREDNPKPYLEIEYDTNNAPDDPSTPTGPTLIMMGESGTYSTSANDLDNDDIKYGWDWDGDSIVDEWTGFHSSGESIQTLHIWNTPGTYYVKVKAKDINDVQSSFSPSLTVIVSGNENEPPNTPELTGPDSGKTGTSYIYKAMSTDPESDDLYYFFDWGDGTNIGWIGIYDSGMTCSESHVWETDGTFVIKVKAKDINGAESSWSELEVIMPKSKAIYTPLFLQKLFYRFPFFEKIISQ